MDPPCGINHLHAAADIHCVTQLLLLVVTYVQVAVTGGGPLRHGLLLPHQTPAGSITNQICYYICHFALLKHSKRAATDGGSLRHGPLLRH